MVRDKYESYIDEDAILPWLFIRRVNEGGYKINQNQIYSQYKNCVDSDGKNFDTPANVQDMISAFTTRAPWIFHMLKREIFSSSLVLWIMKYGL